MKRSCSLSVCELNEYVMLCYRACHFVQNYMLITSVNKDSPLFLMLNSNLTLLLGCKLLCNSVHKSFKGSSSAAASVVTWRLWFSRPSSRSAACVSSTLRRSSLARSLNLSHSVSLARHLQTQTQTLRLTEDKRFFEEDLALWFYDKHLWCSGIVRFSHARLIC